MSEMSASDAALNAPSLTLKARAYGGHIRARASKSVAHRALLAAMLYGQKTRIHLPKKDVSDDVGRTIDALRAVARRLPQLRVTPICQRTRYSSDPTMQACEWEDDYEALDIEGLGLDGFVLEGASDTYYPHGPDDLPQRVINLYAHESGTTLRLLMPIAAYLLTRYRRQVDAVMICGAPSLMARPMADLKRTLIDNGLEIYGVRDGFVLKGVLTSAHFVLPGHISSQYVSGLLLIFKGLQTLGLAPELTLTTPLLSAPYVQMTLHTLKTFGVAVDWIQRADQGVALKPNECDRFICARTPSSLETPSALKFCHPKAHALATPQLGPHAWLDDEGTLHYRVEGDWSNAAFWAVLGALNGGALCPTGVGDEASTGTQVSTYLVAGTTPLATDPECNEVDDWTTRGGLVLENVYAQSEQGDRAILDYLTQMGAQVVWLSDTSVWVGPPEAFEACAPTEITLENAVSALSPPPPPPLEALQVDVSHTPDLVPVLAVACAYAQGTSVLGGIERLRIKESDRVQSTQALLTALGISSQANESFLTIEGHAGQCFTPQQAVDTFNDHRIAMAAAVATSKVAGALTILNPSVVKKSYPLFWQDLEALTL